MIKIMRTRFRCRRLFRAATLAAAGLVAVSLLAADNPPPSPSLDDQLLEELDDALLKGADQPAEQPQQPASAQSKPKAAEPAAKPSDGPTLDQRLLGDADGEDIGAATSQDPLVPIGRRMVIVKSRLSQQKLDGETTQLQQKIIADLAALMQECKKQCPGGGSPKPGSKPGKGGKGSQGGKSPAAQAPSDTARNSSDKLRERNAQSGDRGSLVNAMKESWGNLPEHARKHLSNVSTTVFLPKYELMLEKYFKRLSEQDTSQP
jgi:hypothetical protein